MLKTHFHQFNSIHENTNKKTTILYKFANSKNRVDINKLLNRVRVEKKNETKKNITRYCLITSVLCAFIYIVV